MTSGNEHGDDGRVVGAYRAASEALDEQPQAATRAAILAAAARAVEAQPRDAQTGATGRRPSDKRGAIALQKRSLALVASFLMATVAILLATQVEREPEGPSKAVGAPAPRADTDAAQKTEIDTEHKEDHTAAATPQTSATSEAVRADKAPVARESTRRADRPRAQPAQPPAAVIAQVPQPAAEPAAGAAAPSLAAPSAEAFGPAAGFTAPAPATAPPSLPPVAAADPNTDEARRDRTFADRAPARREAPVRAGNPAVRPLADAGRTGVPESTPLARPQTNLARESDMTNQERLAKARPVERTAALAEGEVENDPARWLQRIIALRDAGHDADADRELARLRERFPDVQVPANALRRAGTR